MGKTVLHAISHLQARTGLMKIPLSLFICLSSVFGYVLKKNNVSLSLLMTAAGVLLLACGSASLNNCQDRHVDLLFSRTRDRAIPSGQLTIYQGLFQSTVLIFLGLAFLYIIHFNLLLPLLGVSALLLYNGVYTPLKKRTLMAILPGAFCGMIPPLIGWTAAGGEFTSIKIWIIMALFCLWQPPHSWLILLDNPNDYQRSGLPNMLHFFSSKQLKNIIFIWITNFAVMMLFIPLLHLPFSYAAMWMVIATAAAVFIAAMVNILLPPILFFRIPLFKYLNATIFFFMITVIINQLIV